MSTKQRPKHLIMTGASTIITAEYTQEDGTTVYLRTDDDADGVIMTLQNKGESPYLVQMSKYDVNTLVAALEYLSSALEKEDDDDE